MQCPHFDVGECRSCPLMGVPYARQLADKQAAVLAALADALDADTVVAEPFASACRVCGNMSNTCTRATR